MFFAFSIIIEKKFIYVLFSSKLEYFVDSSKCPSLFKYLLQKIHTNLKSIKMIINRWILKFGQESINRLYSSKAPASLGFIGTGKIAQALILGLISKHKLRPEQIFASDSNLEYLDYLKNKSPLFQVLNNFKF